MDVPRTSSLSYKFQINSGTLISSILWRAWGRVFIQAKRKINPNKKKNKNKARIDVQRMSSHPYKSQVNSGTNSIHFLKGWGRVFIQAITNQNKNKAKNETRTDVPRTSSHPYKSQVNSGTLIPSFFAEGDVEFSYKQIETETERRLNENEDRIDIPRTSSHPYKSQVNSGTVFPSIFWRVL